VKQGVQMDNNGENTRQLHADYLSLLSVVEDPSEYPDLALVAVPEPELEAWKRKDSETYDLVERIAAKNTVGFARFQSRMVWSGQADWSDISDWGKPLFAEWTDGSISNRFRHIDGDDDAKIWTYIERVLQAGEEAVDGEELFLRKTMSLRADPDMGEGTTLLYHVYLGLEGGSASAYREIFDCLADADLDGGEA